MLNKKTGIIFIISLIISGGALYWSFRGIQFSDIFTYMASMNYYLILLAVIVGLSTFLLRAIRWQVILSTYRHVSLKSAYHPLIIGFMLNCILPARAGEFARPAILLNNEKIPYTTGLATVAAERLFDILFVLILCIFVFSNIEIDPDFSVSYKKYTLNKESLEMLFGGMVKLSIVLFSGIILVSIEKIRVLIKKIIRATPSFFFFLQKRTQEKIGNKIAGPIIRIIDNIATGLSIIKEPKKLIYCLFFSALIWGISVLSYYILALGSPGIDLNIFEIGAVTIMICIFIALPSVPGFWGVWEMGGVFALSIFGIGRENAFSFSLASHAVQMFPVMLAGFVSVFITGVNIFKISRTRTRTRTRIGKVD